MSAIAFFLMICVTGLAAASQRLRLRWVLLLVLALVAFRLTQPVLVEDGCYGVSECGHPQHRDD